MVIMQLSYILVEVFQSNLQSTHHTLQPTVTRQCAINFQVGDTIPYKHTAGVPVKN